MARSTNNLSSVRSLNNKP